jgi:glycosyltransferase involved in cell wall biosynthesis
MAAALPVIGGDVGGIPEMVVHEQTGLLVPSKAPDRLAAALDRLIADAHLRARLGRVGRQRCEDVFGINAHVRNVLAAYESTLAPLAVSPQ